MKRPQVVLVTGCSAGGIGFALAEAFASRGCIVYASARRVETLETLAASIHRLPLDVTIADDCRNAVSKIIAEQGRIDVLVNNAGAGGAGPLIEFDVDEAQRVFEVNLFAPMRLTNLVAPHMIQKRSGTVVNIGSIVGNIATPWTGVYSSSKAAVHSWSEVLRMELKGFGINVLLVAPGAITSNFGEKQSASFKAVKDSVYASAAAAIEARANISQRNDHSISAASLAEGIVARALSSSPVYYTAGGKSLLFWIFERIPRWIVWKLLASSLGTNTVGK